MKSLTFALAMCLCLALFAQNQDRDTTTWFQQLQFKTALLNDSQILTGRLYDRVPQGISPHKYNGQYIDTFNKLNHVDYKQLIWQHSLSLASGNITPVQNYQQYDSLNWHYIREGNIPLNILGYAYDVIRDDAFETGLLTINADSQLIHSSSDNPFDQFSVIASSIWYPTITESNQSVSFILPQKLFVTNISTPVQSIEFKATGGSFFSIEKDIPFTVFFEDTGMKTCVVRITYESGVAVESGFSFRLTKKAEVILPDRINTAIATIPFNQVCNPDPSYSPYGVARYYIKYSNPDKILRRPFIFVEGIDFDYRDYMDNTNNTNFPPAARYGEFGWDVFAGGGNYLQGTPDNSNGAPFSIGLSELAGQQGLIQQLLNEGYDVVLVDFARGADYVQKNAFALIQVIQELNETKISKEENVVVGASMGGLTTRYALAYMEKRNLKHCTRLWCSFDSPHMGANIPVGLQYSLLFFANSDNTARENIRRLNLPAAKQMLIRHISRSYDGTNEIETCASCFRENLITALADIGWPNQLRKIALSNGNVSGLGNGIANGTQLMEWNHTMEAKVLGATLLNYKAAACNIYAQGRSDNLVFSGVITKKQKLSFGGICIGTSVKVVVEPSSGSITIRGALPGIIGVCFKLQISRFWKDEKWNCGGANCPNLDGAPGGLHDGVKSIYDGIQKTAADNDLTPPNPAYVGLVAFIPSISSISVYKTSDYNYNIFKNVDPTSGNDQSPFESYKGPELTWPNEGHVFLTKNNQWGVGYEGNKEYMTQQLALNYNSYQLEIPNSSGTIFNNGLASIGGLKSQTLNSGGSYYINKQGLVGWRTPTNQSSINSSTLSVRTVNNCEDQTVITVNRYGQFVVGDIGPRPINNKGIVTFEQGSSLVLNSESIFIIHKGSKVIIEEGASLYVNQGSIIQIAETGVLEIRGKLFLGTNAILSIDEVPSQGKGFIKFVNNEFVNGISYQINPGLNAKISLTGILSPSGPSKVLEVSGSGGLFLQQHIHPFDFEVANGTIELGTDNFIKSTNNFNLQNVIVKPIGTSAPLGIILEEESNTSAPVIPAISVNDSKFYNCAKGLSITGSNTSGSLTLNHNQFYFCYSGLHTKGIAVNVSKSSFISCRKGWQIENPIGTMLGTELSSSNCGVGIIQSVANPSVLSINKYNSTNDDIGISTSSGILKVKCMIANNNLNAAIVSDNTEVILNGNDAGFNRFLSMQDIGLLLNSQSALSIYGGNNFFSQSPYSTSYSPIADGNHREANLRCSQSVSSDPTGRYMEAIDISGNYLGSTQPLAYKRLCGTVYERGALYNNNAYSSAFVAKQIDNTCGQATGSNMGGYGKKGSDKNNQQNEPTDGFALGNSIETIKVYPNPTQDELTIELNNPEVKEVFLYDTYGRLIYHKKPEEPVLKVNTSTFKSGVYILEIAGGLAQKRMKVTITR